MFKDKASKFDIPDMNFGKIHGHTKIELTSVIDGSKKVIEHDNTFQPGVLAKYMRSLGAINNNPYANSTWNGYAHWRNFVGGILLFKDTIDNSNGEVEYMPKGNQMTANGCYSTTNSENPIELGSYNSLESVIGNNSLTLVYDWDTSHGNGTIGCVCLTSETGGYIGYGNPSNTATSTKRSLSLNQSNQSFQGIAHGNYRYVPSPSGVTKYKFPVTQASIFEGVGELLSHAWSKENYNCPWGSGKGIIGYNSGYAYSIQKDATETYEYFDAETETFGTFQIVNTSGSVLTHRIIRTTDDIIYVATYQDGYSGKAPLHGFKISDGTYVGTFPVPTMYGNYMITGKFTDQLNCCGDNGSLYIQNNPDDNGDYFPSNGIANNLVGSGIEVGLQYDENLDAFELCYDPTSSSSGSRIFKNPLYLATINNLDTPVMKDNTQTMKVTYTLTEVEE